MQNKKMIIMLAILLLFLSIALNGCVFLPQLETPSAYIADDGIMTWKAVPNATKYEIYYRHQTLSINTKHVIVTTEETSYDLSQNEDFLQVADLVVVYIRAIGNSKKYRPSNSNPYGMHFSTTLPKPNVSLNGVIIRWQEIRHAVKYEICKQYRTYERFSIETFHVLDLTENFVSLSKLNDAITIMETENGMPKYHYSNGEQYLSFCITITAKAVLPFQDSWETIIEYSSDGTLNI